MAFTRPTLTELRDRVLGDIAQELGITNLLRRSLERALGIATTGLAHTLHGAIQFLGENLLPDTATDDLLLRWGTIFGVPRNDATFAELTIDITGTTGGTIPDLTVFQRSDGAQYELDGEVTVGAAATESGTIRALTAGADFNLDVGSTVTLGSPIAGVQSEATVTAVVTEAEDEELIEDYRSRVLDRLQQPPAGGKASDYVSWVIAVPGITRGWVIPGFLGPGTVVTFGVEDGNAPASIIPSAAKVQEIQEYVDGLKPVTAEHTAAPPQERDMDPSIQLKPNTVAVQEAVTAELNDLLAREGNVAGALDPEEAGLGTTFSGVITISKINEAISIAAGEEDHILLSPTADVTPLDGELVTLGTVTFSTLP